MRRNLGAVPWTHGVWSVAQRQYGMMQIEPAPPGTTYWETAYGYSH